MITPFYVKAGITPAEFNQRNNLQGNGNVDKQPAGLNFYDNNWGVQAKGQVHIDNGQFSFTVNNVLSTTGTEDTVFPNDGISKFRIRSGITATDFINHDQARLLFMKILQGILDIGWQPYIKYVADPRLLGHESYKYAISDGLYSPDPTYILTLEEWMTLDAGHSWSFQVNGVFMSVAFRRNGDYVEKNGDYVEKNGDGVYLLTFTLITKEEYAKSQFRGDKREQWQSLWIDDIKNDKLMRYKTEVELIKQGYHINTAYVEPLVHEADPVEPDSDEAKALRVYIEGYNN